MSKTGEIGRIGQNRYYGTGLSSTFMEEFLPELRGKKGAQTYTEMADNDATIGAILFAIEMLMRQSEFHIEPGGPTAKDKEAAEFIESCMNDMERTWADTISEILSFLTYGWSYHEIVYKFRKGKTTSPYTNSKYDDGLIGWRKLPIRSQETLEGWQYTDGTDDLIGMVQQPPPTYDKYLIPLEKALHFRTRSRKDNPEGRSILRTAYRAYYFKKRIEEIEGYGIERDLAGFPVLYAPEGMDIWNTEDEEMRNILAYAEMIVSSIRRDAREGLVAPGGENGWKLELLTSGSRRQFDTNAIIERYNRTIATSVLADFVMLGQNQVGSFALADSKTKIFALSIGTYLDVICEVFNNQAIPRLMDMNEKHFSGITDYPKMTHGDIDEPDLAQFTAFVTQMVSAGIVVPDDELEAEVRRIGRLPEKVEGAPPREMPNGAGNPADGQAPNGEKPESKTVYKVSSVMDKYRNGNLTREAAAQMFEDLGVPAEKITFYLNEADKTRKEQEKKKAEEDKEDAKRAQEAKKSLGRDQ